MARKADLGQAPAGTALSGVKGAPSLALRRWRGVLSVCLAAWIVGAPGAQLAVAESPNHAALLLASVNKKRAQADVPALKISAQLNDAALALARHLAGAGRLIHLGRDGEKLGERLQTTGYDYAETAKN